MTGRPNISVVVPVFRNASSLRALRDRVARSMESVGEQFEMVFVDDAAPDGSGRAVEGLAQEDDRVSAVRLARNSGQHHAVLEGLRRAKGERVVVMDADLQDPPEAIPQLLKRLDSSGAAVVFAGRRGRYESVGRLFTSRVYKALLANLAGVPRDAGMFFAMEASLIRQLLAMHPRRPFVVAMIGATGARLASVPVLRDASLEPSSYTGWRRLMTATGALSWALARRLRLPSPSGGAAVEVASYRPARRFSSLAET
jgi:polyisoprenyl-phosphate glycosyltransferase